MKNVFLVFSGHFQSDLFPKGSKVILWYVLVISRFLLLWRVFCKGFQVDSDPFWGILGPNLPKMAENGRNYFSQIHSKLLSNGF